MDYFRRLLGHSTPLSDELRFMKEGLEKDYTLTGPEWESAAEDLHSMQQGYQACGSIDAIYRLIEESDRALRRDGHTAGLIPLATPEAVRQGHAETRPCFQGRSQVHILCCGHAVFTKSPENCGLNCHNSSNGGPHIWCKLCCRRDFASVYGSDTTRWHDLLLPHHINHARESQPKYKIGEPVYLDSRGFMVFPRKTSRVALIRALEITLEEKVKKDITGSCEKYGYKQDIKRAALQNFDALLDCLGGFKYTPLTLAGIVSIHLAALWQKSKCNTDLLFGELQVKHPEDYDTWVAQARIFLLNRQVNQHLKLFLGLVPALYKQTNSKIREVEQMTCRMWILLNEYELFKLEQLIKDWKTIIVFCIEQAMIEAHVPCTHHQIAGVTGETLSTFGSILIRSEIVKFTEDVDWGKNIASCRMKLNQNDEIKGMDNRLGRTRAINYALGFIGGIIY